MATRAAFIASINCWLVTGPPGETSVVFAVGDGVRVKVGGAGV